MVFTKSLTLFAIAIGCGIAGLSLGYFGLSALLRIEPNTTIGDILHTIAVLLCTLVSVALIFAWEIIPHLIRFFVAHSILFG